MFIRPWLDALKSRWMPGKRRTPKRWNDKPLQHRVENLEERIVLSAFDLVTVIPNQGVFLTDGAVMGEAPREVTLRFSPGQTIDPSTLGAITVTRSGLDGVFEDPTTVGVESTDDVSVPLGYIGIGDSPNEVVVRFASTLSDDKYQIRIQATGGSALGGNAGDSLISDSNKPYRSFNFELNLGAQVQSVVPQPVVRSQVFSTTQLSNLTDGDIISIAAGPYTFNFEINLVPDAAVAVGNIGVDIAAGATATDIATALVAKINSFTGGQLSAVNGATNTITVTGATFEPVVTFATANFNAFAKSLLNVADGSKLTDGDVVRLTLTNPNTSLNSVYTFEFNQLPNNITAGGNTRVDFNLGDSSATIATKLKDAINRLAINNPVSQISAEVVGNAIAVTSIPTLGTPSVTFNTTQSGVFSQTVGTLSQATNKVVVYFNQDQLNSAIAQNPAYYRLIDAATGNIALPSSVTYQYNTQNGLSVAVLTFSAALPVSSYNLKIGTAAEPNSTVLDAVRVGTIFSNQDYTVHGYLGDGANSLVSTDSNDVDMYEFTKVGAGTVTLSLQSTAGLNGVLELLDSTGTTISGLVNATGAGGNETFTSGVLGVGKFYARITGVAGSGGYTLTIQSAETYGTGDNNSSFAGSTDLGALGTNGITVEGVPIQIEAQSAYVIMPQLPGGSNEPGHRDLPLGPFPMSVEPGHGTGADAAPAAPAPTAERTYSFPATYGNGLTNQISVEQRAMARQILQIYANYSGIQFREVTGVSSDISIITGDIRAIKPTLDPLAAGGIASGGNGFGTAIINAGTIIDSATGATQGSDITYGGSWFGTAVHEIGHVLGLGHSYDVPSDQGSGGNQEAVFPGDNDIIHLLREFPDQSSDIDLYKFTVGEQGMLSAATRAERLDPTNLLDTVLTLYKVDGSGAKTVIARNDDFYSKDSGINISLTPGVYYIGVTSTGNNNYDPTIANSGNGGTSQGSYKLELDFAPTPSASSALLDSTGRALDGDHDGKVGGDFNSWFVVAPTIFVDKTAPNGGTGTLSSPINNIKAGLAAAAPGSIVRILGNGGADGNVSTFADNVPYAIGKNYDLAQTELSDGATFQIPKDVTVLIDAGALVKVRGQTIDVGSSSAGIDRSHGALQVLGTPVSNVVFTSWRDDAVGSVDDGTNGSAAGADWGGIVFRHDSDSALSATKGVFVNLVNQATIQYGGGQVSVDGAQLRVYNAIDLETSRPTITNNLIRQNADAAISANPDSFQADDGRIGPDIHGNTVVANSTNGLFIRIQTSLGSAAESLNVIARFDDTDITHVIAQNLIINGHPAGDLAGTISARLMIDPGTIIKLAGARIETGLGSANLIAEGTAENPIRFTSQQDDRYGIGGTFDLKNDLSTTGTPGSWSGIFLQPTSTASLDHVSITYAGGSSEIGGKTDYFNPIEALQANLRIANSLFEDNAGGNAATNRAGRGFNDASVIFVRGAQPIIVDNVFRDNLGNVISINANSFQDVVIPDYGRSTGSIDRKATFDDNYGPLVRQNTYENNTTNGMNIRPEELTIASVWDDTDIAHVVRGTITSSEFHTYGGLRLQSSITGSLVVKLEGTTAGFTATGDPLEIVDRVGGTIQIVGQPGFPVILTSLRDDSVSTGFLPSGFPLFDTNNDGSTTSPAAGDWKSISFDQYSNDRNVAIVNESEPPLTQGADINGFVGNSQSLGNLAPNENSGDENRRLGFEVQGYISPDSAKDVDVYSFTANPGTEVWIDLDQTSDRLDVMVELLDSSGSVLARSLNSQAEQSDPLAWFNSGKAGSLANGSSPGNSKLNPLTKDPNLGGDFYTTNFHDAGFRAVLPGNASQTVTYFVRVRSQPVAGTEADPIPLGGNGLTSGKYELQVRLRQQDEQPGSTVRFADIRYAINGIELHGLPAHSPLTGEAGETTGDNNSLNGAQSLGPLLQVDRNTISVAGSLSTSSDVDFYKFTVDYSQIQVISGASDGGKYFPTVFDIDWADGLTRPDTSIAVYNSLGKLIYVGRASDLSDDQPAPGQGQDLDDLTRGSLGIRDPFIGSVNLPAGVNGTSESGGTDPNPLNPTLTTYYVAVYSNGSTPTALTANFNSGASVANQLVRLEPVNSVRRIVEDHIGFTGYNSQGTKVSPSTGPMVDISTSTTLQTTVRPFSLSDVNLFVSTSSSLFIYDPFYGRREVDYPDYATSGVQDLDMRSDGRLYGVRSNTTTGANEGFLVEIDTGTGQALSAVADGIAAVNGSANPLLEQQNEANTLTALAIHRKAQVATDYDYMYYATPDADAVNTPNGNFSKLYRANAGGSAAFVKNSEGAVGLIKDAGGLIVGQTTGMQFGTNGALYGVSDGGQFYRISEGTAPNTDTGNGILSNLAFNVVDFSAASALGGGGFAGLTNAPQNVSNGAYANYLFAITTNGRIVAIDPSNGTLKTIFDNDNNSATGTNGAESDFLALKSSSGGAISTTPTGLAFSPVDFNLWHPTVTRGGDAGHGVTSTSGTTSNPNVDNSRTPTAEDRNVTGGNWTLLSNEANGGASMYFGIEPYTDGLTYFSYDGTQSQYGVLSSIAQRDLTAATSRMSNTYNAPGGTYGSLVTNSFSLEGYSPNDEPVLYFNYWLDTAKDQGNSGFDPMTDSARVYVSTDDGQSWKLVATNNSTLSDPLNPDAELPSYESTASNASAKPNQGVQELFDVSATTDPWRQARIDLRTFVGSSTVKLRFDFSTSGRSGTILNSSGVRVASDDTGNPSYQDAEGGSFGVSSSSSNGNLKGSDNSHTGFFVDDIIVGFAGRGEMVTNAPVDSTFVNLTGANSLDRRTFDADPAATTQLLSGQYQLSLRRGQDYGALPDPAKNDVLVSGLVDINDRLTSGQTIFVGDAVDQTVLTIYDGFNTFTFEFDNNGSTTLGRIPVTLGASRGATAVNLANAITSTFTSNKTVIAKAVASGNSSNSDRVDLFGAVSATTPTVAPTDLGTLGDPAGGFGVGDGYPINGIANTVAPLSSGTPGNYILHGEIGNGPQPTQDIDFIRLSLIAGQKLRVDLDITSGVGRDSFMVLLDSSLALRAVSFDDPAPGENPSYESYFEYTVPTTGVYYIGIAGDDRDGLTLPVDLSATFPAPLANSGNDTFTYDLNVSLIGGGAFRVESYTRRGDDNLVRQQGQFIIENNTIRNVGDNGILIDDSQRTNGLPHPGAVQNTPVTNTSKLVTGLYIQNNVIAKFANNGINIGGDTNTASGTAATPFVKIVNNTLYGPDAVAPGSATADVVILIDVSTSMGSAISTLKSRLLQFDAQMKAGNIDARYGLVLFPQSSTTAPIQKQDFTDFATFTQAGSAFDTITLTGGIENGSQAVLEGLNAFDPSTTFNFRPGARPVMLILTDEDDDSTSTEYSQALAALSTNNALFFAIANPNSGNTNARYGTMAATSGGGLFSITSFLNNTGPFFSTFTTAVVGALGASPTGVGINVANNATATIMNNVIANTTTGIAVDSTSSVVVDANLFQGNVSDGVLGNNALYGADTAGIPLFVDPLNNNFYPAPGSPVIDSSRSTFNDRDDYIKVTSPLSIPQSPIIAPIFDRFGQLRVDDSTQPGPSNQPGLGSNPFQDRGAIERADFQGGLVIPTAPADNDLGSVDLDSSVSTIWIDSANSASPFSILTKFTLQLIDAGIGIDDSSVLKSNFLLLKNGSPLVEGQDYFFTYNQNTNEAIFTSVSTFALDSRYQIVLNGQGITDLAGNALQNNQAAPFSSINPNVAAPFDSSLLYFTYIVTDGENTAPVNTAPVAVSLNEDTSIAFTGANTISVTDADAFLASDGDPTMSSDGGRIHVSLSVPDGFGTLTLGSTLVLTQNGGAASGTGTAADPLVIDGRITDINAVLAGLIFTPPADFPPTVQPAIPLTIATSDLGKFGTPVVANVTTTVVNITVNPVNDRPAFVKGLDRNDKEGDPAVVNAAWASGISTGAANETTQTVQFQVTANTNTSLFSVLPTINAAGQLSYTLAPDAFGFADITVVIKDNGGTANGGVDTSAPQTFRINVAPLNDAPSFVKGADENVSEDAGVRTVPSWATSILAGPANESSQVVTFQVTGNTNPGLFEVAPTISANGTLSYKLAANANGFADITVRLKDNGGTLNVGDVDTSAPQTFRINVAPLNDAPTYTKGANQNVLGDVLFNSVSGWASNITAGPADESGQTVQFIITGNSDPSLFTVQPAIAPDGTLTYTLSPTADGEATITFHLEDNGATGGGNVNRSADDTFKIRVTVNNAPSFTLAGPETQSNEDFGPRTVANWATSISAGPPDEAGQVLTFIVTNNTNPALFSVAPAISSTGTLTYTLAPNANGFADVTVVLKDDGGTHFGVDTSAPQTFRITANALNDAPSFTKGADQNILETDTPQVVTGWATNLSAGPADESGQTLSFNVVGNTNPGLFLVAPAIAPNGTLTYTLAPNAVGSAAIRVNLADNGSFGNGNVNVSADQTFNIVVTGVNDAPSFVKGSDQSVTETYTLQTVTGWATSISAGPANEGSQTVSFIVTGNTNPGLFAVAPSISPNGTLTYQIQQYTPGIATITVKLQDSGGTLNGGVDTSTEQTFVIESIVIYDAPTDIGLSGPKTVTENLPAGTVVGTLTSVDPDIPAGTFTYSLVTGAGSSGNDAFIISGDQLLTNQSFNFEAQSSYSIRIRTTDNTGRTFDKIFTIQILDVNEAATTINTSVNPATGVPNSILENRPTNSIVGTLLTDDVDLGDVTTFTLVAGAGSTDNSLFFISGNSLIAKPSFNYEAKSSYTVRIRAVDSHNAAFETPLTITVFNVNEAPTNISLSSNSVVENSPVGTPIGDFSTIDPDAGDTFTYSFVSGTGSTDNGKFEIVNGQLQVAIPPDYEYPGHFYTIRVRATDAGNNGSSLSFEKTFTISIVNVNEAPTGLTLVDQSVEENKPIGTVVGTLGTVDPDVPDVFTYALVSGDGADDNNLFSISGDKLVTATTFDFETRTAYSVRVRTTDSSGHQFESSFAITITDGKDAPIISLSPTPITTRVRKPIQIDPGAQFSDRDSDVFDGGKLVVKIYSGEQPGDALRIMKGSFNGLTLKAVRGHTVLKLGKQEIATISGGSDFIPLTITFHGNVSTELFQKVMQSITLKAKPYPAPRVISMQAYDETGLASNIAMRSIEVT